MSLDGIIIRPVTITEAMLISSNAEETYPLWDDGETAAGWPTFFYAGHPPTNIGDIVRSPTDNHLYESLVGTGFDSGLCSMTNADPCVVTTATPHGLSEYDVVTFTSEGTGPFPASVSVGLPYLVHVLSDTTFNLYADNFEPISETLVSTVSESGSGLHAYASYDLNTGYWGDPGDPDFETNAAAAGTWVTSPRWLDLGPNNTWAMFDASNGSATTHDDDLIVVLEPGTRVDAMGLESLIGGSVHVVVNDGSTDVYDETYSLVDSSEVVDWYSFFFGARLQKTTLVISDLPQSVTAPEITVTVVAASGLAAVGTLQIGRQFEIGSVEYGLSVGIRDYSTKEADDFGEYTIVQRAFSKRAEGRAMLPNTRVDVVQQVLAAYRTTPLFWQLSDGFSAAVIFGFFRSFEIEIAYPNQSLVTYEIEGVT